MDICILSIRIILVIYYEYSLYVFSNRHKFEFESSINENAFIMIRGAVIVWCISSIFFLLDMTNGVQIHNWIKQN